LRSSSRWWCTSGGRGGYSAKDYVYVKCPDTAYIMTNRVLLLGNGVNRLSQEYSWSDLLDDLIREAGKQKVIRYKVEKPFTLLYEEIYLRSLKHTKKKELRLKQKIADLVISKFAPSDIHAKLLNLNVEHILTTNYDYNLEQSVAQNHGKAAHFLPERKYNLFRRRTVNGKSIWHLHGEAEVPRSITLGHEHYVGYLQQMGNYLKPKRKGEAEDIGSPLQRAVYKREAIPDYTQANIYSWVDLFIMNDVYILGLSLDYTEIDLWWLLIYKERLKHEKKFDSGKTIYYCFYPHKIDNRKEAKLSLLESLGIKVKREDVGLNYEHAADAYADFIKNFSNVED
jgi:hypothetical protein